ncbi:MAG TPA: amino acid adenylation domain-containing protein [Streptosporangiaceae bacterium]|jgi:amino acid adenylation domain-containing protein
MLSDVQRAALAARLRRDRVAGPDRDRADGAAGEQAAGPSRRITRRPAGTGNPPASFGQEQLWFLDRFAPGRAPYNMSCPVHIRGLLDQPALSRAVDALVARHEALRTRLAVGEGGHPVQVIDPPPSGVTKTADYGQDGRQAAWPRLVQLAADELGRPFDLARGPLLRVCLVRLGAEEHVLVITVHHAVFDGFSAGVLLRDLSNLYAAQAAGTPCDLAELPVQFGDYAWWERGRLQGSTLGELEAYWRGALDGAQTLRLPTDWPRPAVESFTGREEVLSLPVDLRQGLAALAHREGTTLFVTLMAAWQALLHRCTGQTDVVVGTVSANRGRAALEPLVAFLVNTLPIRVDLSGDPAFTELLGRTRQATLSAYAHQDLPFAKIVETLRVERDASRPPVIQVMLSLVDTTPEAPVPAGGVTFELAGNLSEADASKFDISLFVLTGPDEFAIQAVYASDLFEPATIRRLLGNLEVLLRGVLANPSARLSRLPVLTPAERQRELADWNDTAREFPAVCLHQGFERQVARTPQATAVEFGDERLSYAQLDRQASSIACWLRAAGVGPEVLVGVALPPSARRLAALLGILKAGGAYLPLDPALPPERLSFMMTDAALSVVLAENSVASAPAGVTVLRLDTSWPAIAGLDGPGPGGAGPAVSGANAAYVIYTSGSTGRPKGVVVEHRQAVNLAYGTIANLALGPQDAVLQFASLSFDVSVKDMFATLLAGGRLVIVPAQTRQSARELAALIRRAAVTVASLTPSVLSLLADEGFPSLRAVVAGGEEVTAEFVQAWQRPGLRLCNGYGPTEATVTSTFATAQAGPLPPPIGRPIPNYRAYVLDPYLNPVPVGTVGELHVGGAGVARGYLNRPALTSQRFVADPFVPGSRLYKTGDLVRRRTDGSIVFVGRTDGQVKIRGLRIELGEIEAALVSHPDVAQAVVTVLAGPAGEKQLAGYLRPEPGREPDAARLRAHLAGLLPGYMVPPYLTTVAAFPLNASGKIDKAALPPPQQAQAAAAPAAPATTTEKVLTRLYGAVLGRDQVGVTDSFFDAGGSSLQVMRLVDLIGRELGVDAGVATVFRHPAPRQLAARLDAIRSGVQPSDGAGPLVELSQGTGERPLFVIHPVGGTVSSYLQLARELDEVFQVYGLEAPGLRTDAGTAPSLAALVSDYTRRIRSVQPAGPYHLAGWSIGGVIAFEIARQLEQSGERVASLVLLDAPFAIPAAGVPSQDQLAARFVADAAQSLGWDAASLPDPASTDAAGQLDWLTRQLGGTGGVAEELRRRFGVFQAHVRMLAGYRAQQPAVRAATLIVSADGSPNAPHKDDWPHVLTGPVTVQIVPGDHYDFLRPPLVAEVGIAIQKAATTKS